MARPMILMLILESSQEEIVLVLNRYEEEQEQRTHGKEIGQFFNYPYLRRGF
jgi:hypothetical protein